MCKKCAEDFIDMMLDDITEKDHLCWARDKITEFINDEGYSQISIDYLESKIQEKLKQFEEEEEIDRVLFIQLFES